MLAASDAAGERVPSWPTTYATVWAEKIEIRAREFFSAQTTEAQMTTRFRILHRSDVLMTDRIFFGGLSYGIEQITEVGRRGGLEIYATAVQP